MQGLAIGIVTPHATVGPEQELPAMAADITVRVVRVPVEVGDAETVAAPPTSPAGLRALTAASVLDEAVELVLAEPVDAIAYASTSSAYAIGYDGEVALLARLSERTGVPVVGTCAAAVRALRLLDARRVALMHPPWFDLELNELGASYFRSQGFDVVLSASAELPPDPDRIESPAVVEWCSRHVPGDAEAIFIGGNGFRAAVAIEPLERTTECLVLESNQLLLWEILARTGSTLSVRCFGRLFA
jgi:maleate isomerase